MRLLISVASAQEIGPALAGGAQILDVKDPRLGSLGTAGIEVVRAGLAAAGAVPVSAALGDSPAAWAPTGNGFEWPEGVEQLAASGTSFLKVGLAGVRPSPARAALERLRARLDARGRAPATVAVAFADAGPRDVAPWELPDVAGSAGVTGAMLDTLGKGRSILRMLGEEQVARWIGAVRERGLLCGIAGSLSIGDAAVVTALGPDVVGLRGAVCAGGRSGSLEMGLVRRAREAVDAAGRAALATVEASQ